MKILMVWPGTWLPLVGHRDTLDNAAPHDREPYSKNTITMMMVRKQRNLVFGRRADSGAESSTHMALMDRNWLRPQCAADGWR